MPPKTPYPTPALRHHNGAWKIIWNLDGKQYSVSTGLTENDKVFAERWRAEFAIALKQDTPAFPERFADSPSVERYIKNRYGIDTKIRTSTGNWLTDYAPEINSECSKRWAKFSLDALKKLDLYLDGIAKATPDRISKYLSDIAEKHKPATRNRIQNIFSRFFSWAVRTHRAKINPAAGIKRLTEERRSDIVHCTPAERDEAIALATEAGWRDWLAIPVAFYTGMRREEISRLQWEDIRFSEGLIVVQKSKTGKSRVLPLASALEKILLEFPARKRSGLVVTTLPTVDRLLRLDNLVRHIRRMKRDRLLAAWSLQKPPPSKAKDYRDRFKAWKAAMAEKTDALEAALNRIGWNSFRHTFGSLLAQGGVSIDKISSWMGNTPEVCRRHYAQFIPRDRRDSEIDKL